MDSKRPATYCVIEEENKNILLAFYNRGMKTTLADELIKAAAEETRLSTDKIKKWIGNQNAKLKRKGLCDSVDVMNKEPLEKRIKKDRKVSGHNMFYSQLSREGKLKGIGNNTDRNNFVWGQWKNLSVTEKENFNKEAERINSAIPDKMTESERMMCIKKHKKKLLHEISILEQLGVESANILFDENNELFYYGSTRGIDCLTNNSKIDLEFRKYFEIKEKERTFSYKDLQNMYNKAYAKAIDVPAAKVPYLKGNFVIEGLPDDIQWKNTNGCIKKPCDYGQKSINRIMRLEHEIKFVIIPAADEPSSRISNVPASMLKLVDESAIQRALNGGEKIKESEIDVFTRVRNEEYEEIVSQWLWCFTEDAINMIHQSTDNRSDEEMTIVATFTNSPKAFWLFCYEGKEQELNCLQNDNTIPGRWLQKVRGQRYRLLNDPVSIKHLNVIKDKNGEVISSRISRAVTDIIIDKNFTGDVKNRLRELNKK